MAEIRICSIPDCGKPIEARGWCRAHYRRWQRHGDPCGGGTTHGALAQFIETVALPFKGSGCLAWPFGKISSGYGATSRDGKTYLAHRLVCERVYGPAPSPKHEAAHSCGKGHLGCCNPTHLRWATPAENCADRLIHGTHSRGERCGTAKLTEADVMEIRRLQGKVLQREIGEKFGVSQSNVSDIHRRERWAWLGMDAGDDINTELKESKNGV